ncbi:MAG: hypothetical protein LBQ28_08010 [Prevotellaceae bacterium]|jgi:hypothetical protein|nr:hypothetical protein [Prevotellaceae bacterium]
MKKYYLSDGGVVQAESPCQFVTELRLGSRFDSECSDEEYMRNFADRYKIYSSVDMCYNNAEEFLNILIETGYIERIE